VLATADQIASVIATALAVGVIVATWLGLHHRGNPRKIRRDVIATSVCTVVAIVAILVVASAVDGGEGRAEADPEPVPLSTPTGPPSSTPDTSVSSSEPAPTKGINPEVPGRTSATARGGPASTVNGNPPTGITTQQQPLDTIVIGMGVSASPRSGAVSCGSGSTVVFTFEVATRKAGTVHYVLRPEQGMNLPERSGSLTFSAANTDRVRYEMPRTGSPGQQLRGGLIAEVVSPEGDRGIVGDQYDLTCQ
jgi:hypothetical protein